MDSPFAQFLSTNYAPSDSEVKQIQTHLVSHLLEASRLEALILELSTQREKTLRYIDAHRELLSPARRLPRDIIQEIFLACLPTQRNAVERQRGTARLGPHLHLHSPVVKWLERSGRCPLSLSLIGSRNLGQWEDSDPDSVQTVTDELVRSSDRWAKVELSFDPEEGLLRLAQAYAPKLVAVKMTCDPREILKTKFLTAPSLREVTLLIAREFDRYIPQLPLRWDYLTHLSFDSRGIYRNVGLSPSTTFEILRRCPRLLHFKSDVHHAPALGNHTDYPPVSQVSLPALREFIMCRCNTSLGPKSIMYLVQHLLMPQLRHLQLPRTDTSFQVAFPFLGDLATRSPLLEYLDLDLTGLTQDSLFDSLRMFHSLGKLVAGDCVRPNDDSPYAAAKVQGLLDFLGSSAVCPLLHELQLLQCRDLAGGDEDLFEFARRRLDSGSGHFRRLDVVYRFFTLCIAPEFLAPFAARGLTISTTCPANGFVELPTDTPWTGLDD
ncbi:hypothetical protein FB451DRAFT_1391576 [Mycena latifolia]|nr:hypothetical protein FB451DRAFT_1391576 [Mycena latifolia]